MTLSMTMERYRWSNNLKLGKKISDTIYFHTHFTNLLPKEYVEIIEEVRSRSNSFGWANIIKLTLHKTMKISSISFIFSPDFLIADEPIIENAWKVNMRDGNISRREFNINPPVYHHKWLFVTKGSELFDVEASVARSQWVNAKLKKFGINKKTIGWQLQWKGILSQINKS